MTDKKLTSRQYAYWSNKARDIQLNLAINYLQFKEVVIEGKTESAGLSYEGFDVSACVARIKELEQDLERCLNKLGWTEENQLYTNDVTVNYWSKRNDEYRAELKSALIDWEHEEGGKVNDD